MKAFTRPRPVRVAFLVEESEHWRAIVEGIIANCYGRWGGRFSLLVPCVDGQIVKGFDAWLERYDPDIIYSYVALSADAQRAINERYSPSYLIVHTLREKERIDAYAFRPKLPIACLSSLTVTVAASQGGQISGPKPIHVLDTHPGTKTPPFVQENFGVYQLSHDAWPIAADMQTFVQSTIFASDEIATDRRMLPATIGTDIVTDQSALLDRIGSERGLVGMAALSAWQTPRLEIRHTKWSEQIIVVIGDGFADSVAFWNARALQPAWLDSGFVTLKVSRSDLDNPTFFAQFQTILRNRIRMPVGGQSNSTVKLYSSSIPAEDLLAIRDRFRQTDHWNVYISEHGSSLTDVCPTGKELENAHETTDGAAFFQTQDWHEIDFSESTFRPLLVTPIHIRNAPMTPSAMKRGAWVQELDIEREINHSNLSNVTHHWRLPLRLRMTEAFCKVYQMRGRSGELCVPRTTQRGLLAIFSEHGATLPELKLPTDEDAFRFALCPRYYPIPEGTEPSTQHGAFDVRPSDKGRYLKALVRMSDSVARAREIFLNGFWKLQFELVGAATTATDARTAEIVRKLRKKLRSGVIETDDQWDRLAVLVLAESRSERFARRYLRFDELTKSFEDYRNEFWERHQPGTPREEWDESERRSLAASTQYLCSREILHQGTEWLCHKCNNNNWVSIDAIRKRMTCEVCDATQAAPVADSWHFKLNNFVRDGLREHGLLAHIWCLVKLEQQAQASFFFLEPHELFWSDESADLRRPDAELDLLAVTDGVVRLCEVKTSNKGIDIPKFAALAIRLRPDVATLAVMESKSPALQKSYESLSKLLEGTGIQAELMTLNPSDIDDGPNLPTGQSFRVRVF